MHAFPFSFHEMGVYDIPAQLKYISSARQQTGNIIYIGYSMGTTASYIYSSRNPQESAKLLKMIVSLAPVAYMKNIISPLRFIALAWNLIDVSSTSIRANTLEPFFYVGRLRTCNVCTRASQIRVRIIILFITYNRDGLS